MRTALALLWLALCFGESGAWFWSRTGTTTLAPSAAEPPEGSGSPMGAGAPGSGEQPESDGKADATGDALTRNGGRVWATMETPQLTTPAAPNEERVTRGASAIQASGNEIDLGDSKLEHLAFELVLGKSGSEEMAEIDSGAISGSGFSSGEGEIAGSGFDELEFKPGSHENAQNQRERLELANKMLSLKAQTLNATDLNPQNATLEDKTMSDTTVHPSATNISAITNVGAFERVKTSTETPQTAVAKDATAAKNRLDSSDTDSQVSPTLDNQAERVMESSSVTKKPGVFSRINQNQSQNSGQNVDLVHRTLSGKETTTIDLQSPASVTIANINSPKTTLAIDDIKTFDGVETATISDVLMANNRADNVMYLATDSQVGQALARRTSNRIDSSVVTAWPGSISTETKQNAELVNTPPTAKETRTIDFQSEATATAADDYLAEKTVAFSGFSDSETTTAESRLEVNLQIFSKSLDELFVSQDFGNRIRGGIDGRFVTEKLDTFSQETEQNDLKILTAEENGPVDLQTPTISSNYSPESMAAIETTTSNSHTIQSLTIENYKISRQELAKQPETEENPTVDLQTPTSTTIACHYSPENMVAIETTTSKSDTIQSLTLDSVSTSSVKHKISQQELAKHAQMKENYNISQQKLANQTQSKENYKISDQELAIQTQSKENYNISDQELASQTHSKENYKISDQELAKQPETEENLIADLQTPTSSTLASHYSPENMLAIETTTSNSNKMKLLTMDSILESSENYKISQQELAKHAQFLENNQTSAQERARCVLVNTTLPFCSHAVGKKVVLPNYLNQTRVEEVGLALDEWAWLLRSKCHHSLEWFFCLLVVPECGEPRMTPCRSFCTVLQDSCWAVLDNGRLPVECQTLPEEQCVSVSNQKGKRKRAKVSK